MPSEVQRSCPGTSDAAHGGGGSEPRAAGLEGHAEDAMNDDMKADEPFDEPEPIPSSARPPGEARRPDRVRPAGQREGGEGTEDDGPDSDESGGPTAPQRPPSDS